MLTIAMTFLILLIITFVLNLIVTIKSHDSVATFASYLLGLFSGGLLVFTVASFMEYKSPTPIAMDVYRGKTTLVIEYELRDSVITPIDSTVRFKNYGR